MKGLLEKVRGNLESVVNVGDKLVVGVSGGVDSMVFLDVICRLKDDLKVEVLVAHLNHCLRGSESDGDADFVSSAAEIYDLKICSKAVDVGGLKGSLETNARKVRYDFFDEVLKKNEGDWIVTAHHANDSLETMLMNLIRGTGLRGVVGIELVNGNLLRPFFNVTKEEILKYAEDENIRYREDVSNIDESFTRNLIRRRIVPEIKKINPSFEATFLSQQEHWGARLREDIDWCEKWLEENGFSGEGYAGENLGVEGLKFGRMAFKELSVVKQVVLLMYLYEFCNGSTLGIGSSHIEQVLEVLNSPSSGLRKEFGFGKWIVVGRDWIEII